MSGKLFAGKYADKAEGVPLEPSDIPHHDTLEDHIDHILAEYEITDSSVRPYLVSLPLVKRLSSDNAFRFGVTGEIELESANPFNEKCMRIIALATIERDSTALYSALRICSDLRTIFLRHYPGRCHRNTSESNFGSFKPSRATVYVAFFDKAVRPPGDGV